MIQTLVKKERFTLVMTKTRFGCQLMQIESHVMKDVSNELQKHLGSRWFNTVEKGNIKEPSFDALCKLL